MAETAPGETILMRFDDGPLVGTRTVEVDQFGWPPPVEIDLGSDGTYERTNYSQLTEPVPGVLRGAQYRLRM